MKKILISILTILGIGLSFCSANSLSFNAFSSRPIYDSSMSLLDNNFSFNLDWSKYELPCYDGYPWGGSSVIVNLSGFVGDYYLLDLCIRNSKADASFNIDGIGCSVFTSGDFRCCDFSESPISLSSTNSFTINGLLWGNNITTICSYPFTYFNRNYTEDINSFYLGLGDGKLVNFSFTNIPSGSTPRRYIPVPVSFTIGYSSDSKFKVNYGNTSYEYTLEDNLEIRLNSPVLKDGDNYSYDGSTGINLFYNGTSQRYNKSELYLFTPSWYSNNIFTPICL